ncbi:MAG: Lrp/AsnC family transcriptional regulator, partial [Saccharolobus sp.]
MNTNEITDTDKQILMKLQYEFPFDPEPFKIISDQISLPEEMLINRVKTLVESGIIKRIGMYINFRSKG